jgi:hypothetical protein
MTQQTITIEPIFELPGLPYATNFQEWELHLEDCAKCTQAVINHAANGGGDRDVTALCAHGWILDHALEQAIINQHRASACN